MVNNAPLSLRNRFEATQATRKSANCIGARIPSTLSADTSVATTRVISMSGAPAGMQRHRRRRDIAEAW